VAACLDGFVGFSALFLFEDGTFEEEGRGEEEVIGEEETF